MRLLRHLKCAVFLFLAGAGVAQSPGGDPARTPTPEPPPLYDARTGTWTKGAAPEPTTTTRFAGHLIGESFDRWIAINQIDLPEICGPHSKKDHRMDFKTTCSNLTALRSGETGQCPTEDSSHGRIDWFFANSHVGGANMEVFLDSFSAPSSAREQVAFLQELYGPPTKLDTVHNSNAFGGTWDTIEAYWELPDGATVFGIEHLSFNSTGPSRTFLVAVSAANAKSKTVARPKNPYGPQ